MFSVYTADSALCIIELWIVYFCSRLSLSQYDSHVLAERNDNS